MTKDNHQKIRLLRIYEILRNESGPEHPIKTSDMTAKLAELGIKCDRRTFARDVDLLNAEGFEIFKEKNGHDMYYWVDDSRFSDSELSILLTQLQASKYLSKKKTAVLTEKVANIGGIHRAEMLSEQVERFNNNKRGNEQVYYIIDFINTALREGRMLSFEYRVPDENHNLVLHNPDKPRHTVEPVKAIIADENFYLICYDSSKPDLICTYRIDRMYQVNLEGAMSRKAKNFAAKFDIAKYHDQVVRMFGGELMKVTLEFSKKMIPAIYDEFGDETEITKIDDNKFIAEVDAQISPTFWGWLFTFQGQIKIAGPEEVQTLKTQYLAYLVFD